MFKEPTRIIVPTLSVSILLLVLGSLAAWYLHRLQQSSSELLVASISKTRTAEELVVVSQELEALVDRYLLAPDESLLGVAMDLKKRAGNWLERAEQLARTNQERTAIEQVRKGYRLYFERIEMLRRQPRQDNPEAIVKELRELRTHQIVEPAEKYRLFNRERATEASERNQKMADRMGLALVLFGMCGATAGLLAGFVIARGVHQQLERTRRAAMQSRQLAAMGQLAAGLAHELRNPLTSMKIIAQTATVHADNVVLDRRDFGVLEEEIERLNASIQTFLDFARPVKPEKKSCVIPAIIDQTVTLLSHRATQLGVRFEVKTPEELTVVGADPGQMKQLLLNLLINATDASPQGGTVSITVDDGTSDETRRMVDPSESGGGQLVLEVADRGEGLPTELADRIFEPFVSTKVAGMGLGLAICKRIVEEHGGTIQARNRPDGGTVFRVTLPYRRSAMPRDTSRPPASPDVAGP